MSDFAIGFLAGSLVVGCVGYVVVDWRVTRRTVKMNRMFDALLRDHYAPRKPMAVWNEEIRAFVPAESFQMLAKLERIVRQTAITQP